MDHRSLRRWTGGAGALMLVAFLALPLHAQQPDEPYAIQGTVVDAGTEQPIAGAAAQLRGTQHGSLTNAEGRFSFTADVEPGTYTVRVSLIGYGPVTQEVELEQQAEVDLGTVALAESAVELGEIVVTGTGVPTERRRLGNVVESVSGDDVNLAPAAPSIDAALQGKVTGAVISQNHGQVGGGVSIRLRGTSSILGGAEPLIVVDGVIADNNSEALIALGADAGRGGAALSNRLSDLAPADIERIEVIKGAAAAALYGSRANNGVIQIFTRRGQDGAPQITFRTEGSLSRTPSFYPTLDSPVAGPGDVVFIGSAEEIGQPVERFNIQDRIFRTGFGARNQLSVSGGGNGTRYYVSGAWDEEQGILQSQDNSRVSARARIDQELADNFEIGVNANYIQRVTNYIPEGEQTQGVSTSAIFTPSSWNFNFDDELGRFPYNPILTVNPLDVFQNWTMEQDINRFVGSVNAAWTPLPDLSITYLFGLDDSREENTYLRPRGAQGATYSGEIQNPVRLVRQYNNDLTVTHSATLSPALDLTTTAGGRQTFDRTDVVRAAASELPFGQRTVGGAVQTASQGITEILTLGGFVQAQLGIGDRLILTGAVNSEASSAFGDDERWQLFPRLGASYIVSDEPFWQGSAVSNLFSSLRLRASYGETGGQPPGAYIRFDNYNSVTHAGRAGVVGSTVEGNPNLRPERQREYEGGLDVGLLDDRLNLELTYYDQRTTDLVLGVPIQASAGFTTQFQNVGIITNRGVEVTLNSLNLRTPAFSWNSRLSYAANRNRVEQIFGDTDRLPPPDYLNYVIEGEPVGVFFGGRYERDAEGNIALNEDGLPMRAEDDGILGDPNPDFTLSLGNDLDVGDNLRFSVLLDGRFGNDVANFTRRISEFFGAAPATQQEIDGDVPVGFYFLNGVRHLIFEEFVEDGSFVKVREASLRYRFDQPWVQRLGARSIDLSLAGRNLFTFTNYRGVDPEINLFSNNTVQRGVDFGTTPIPRSVVLGVTLGF